MYDLVIWDFNGTIADDIAIGIEAANVVLSSRGMNTIDSIDDYRDKFCFPIIEFYKKLGFDFSAEPYEVPADEWTAEYIKREGEIKLTEGCLDALAEIKRRGIPQVIISSSEKTMLIRQIDTLGIRDYFDDVIGKEDNYASGKVEIAKRWASDKSAKALFIGDTDHDCATARAIGADCVLFSGGHNSKARLLALGVPVVDRINDIVNYL